MSSQDSELLKLYKNTYLYNGSRYQFLMTGRTDGQTFEQWLGNPSYSKSVYFKSINEPITINESIKNCDEYTYGSITNDGKTYYLFVDNITTDAYKQTTINYTIDWWTTNWSNINCTKAHITRQPIKPQYMSQPYSPISTTSNSESLTSDFCIMATYIPSLGEDVPSYICNIVIPGNWDNLRMAEQGYWYQFYNIAGADIKDCFIVPYFSYSDIGRSGVTPYGRVYNISTELYDDDKNFISGNYSDFVREWYKRMNNLVGNNMIIHQEIHDLYFSCDVSNTTNPEVNMFQNLTVLGKGSDLNFTEYQEFTYKIIGTTEYKLKLSMINSDNTTYPNTKTLTKTFTSNDKQKQGIMDWNGNLIWECPYGVTINSFTVRLETGISHVFLKFLENNNEDDLLTNRGFTYDCRHVGLFVDSYQDYILKNRDYDIAMRKIQSEKQEVQAWTSVAENIGFGFAFGDTVGAAAAGIGGVIEATSTWLLNEYYDPKIQQQYNNRYARMTDQISLIGDTLTPLYFFPPLSKYTLTMDIASQNHMKIDVETNGYTCDEITAKLSSLFKNTITYNSVDDYTVNPVFQADNVVVEGACNVIGKQQVVRRLQNGVEFI